MAPPGVGTHAQPPFLVTHSSVLQCLETRVGILGLSYVLPHCPPPFCTLPVHTPHVAQVGKTENKVYLHSHR